MSSLTTWLTSSRSRMFFNMMGVGSNLTAPASPSRALRTPRGSVITARGARRTCVSGPAADPADHLHGAAGAHDRALRIEAAAQPFHDPRVAVGQPVLPLRLVHVLRA